jgi:hypothetical protein
MISGSERGSSPCGVGGLLMRLYTTEWLFMRLADQITEYDRTVAGHGLFSSAKLPPELPPDWSILVDIRQYGLRG